MTAVPKPPGAIPQRAAAMAQLQGQQEHSRNVTTIISFILEIG